MSRTRRSNEEVREKKIKPIKKLETRRKRSNEEEP
jgi:hypothetical protein